MHQSGGDTANMLLGLLRLGFTHQQGHVAVCAGQHRAAVYAPQHARALQSGQIAPHGGLADKQLLGNFAHRYHAAALQQLHNLLMTLLFKHARILPRALV